MTSPILVCINPNLIPEKAKVILIEFFFRLCCTYAYPGAFTEWNIRVWYDFLAVLVIKAFRVEFLRFWEVFRVVVQPLDGNHDSGVFFDVYVGSWDFVWFGAPSA